MPTIAILGTFDSKGPEHAFLADCIRARGFDTLLINAGSLSEPGLKPDVSSDEVAAASGQDWKQVLARQDRGECVTLMAQGAACVVADLASKGRVQGIISLGGGGGQGGSCGGSRWGPAHHAPCRAGRRVCRPLCDCEAGAAAGGHA